MWGARRTSPRSSRRRANTAAPSSACGSSSGASTALVADAVERVQPAGAPLASPSRDPTPMRGCDQEPAPAERAQHAPFRSWCPGTPRGPGRAAADDRAPSTGARAGIAAHGSLVATRIAGALSTPRTRARPGRPAAAEIAATATPQTKRESWATRRAPRGFGRSLFAVGDGHGDPVVQGPDTLPKSLRSSASDGRIAGSGPGRRRSPRRGAPGRSGRYSRRTGNGFPISRAVCAGVGASDRVDARPALVQRQGQRVDVGGLLGGLALRLLGGHVGQRADHLAGRGQRGSAGERRDPEVHELGSPPRSRVDLDDDVVGLDVSMDHAARVRMGERRADVRPERGDLAIGEIAGLGELGERRAVHQFADQQCAPTLGPELVQGHDARVIEARGRLGLAQYAVARPRRGSP